MCKGRSITHPSFSSITIINGHALAVINIAWTGFWKRPVLAAFVTLQLNSFPYVFFSFWLLFIWATMASIKDHCSLHPFPAHFFIDFVGDLNNLLKNLHLFWGVWHAILTPFLYSVSSSLGNFSGCTESSQTSGFSFGFLIRSGILQEIQALFNV